LYVLWNESEFDPDTAAQKVQFVVKLASILYIEEEWGCGMSDIRLQQGDRRSLDPPAVVEHG
jgi:hypothetical protein